MLFWQWQPITTELWRVDHPALGVQATGWAMVLVSTFLINHFELFGLRQVYDHLRQRPESPHRFVTPFLYRIVRHPIMLGFLLAFWATPVMTAGKLLFAAGMTTYILIGVHFEERDLARTLGAEYEDYRERVPGLVPGAKWRSRNRMPAPRGRWCHSFRGRSDGRGSSPDRRAGVVGLLPRVTRAGLRASIRWCMISFSDPSAGSPEVERRRQVVAQHVI